MRDPTAARLAGHRYRHLRRSRQLLRRLRRQGRGFSRCGTIRSIRSRPRGTLWILSPNPRSSRQRALADGITASVLSPAPGQPACTVRWAEGKWYVDLVGNTAPGQWEPAAEQVVAYLHTHLLPPVSGFMSVDLAGDGEHTTLAWPEGSDLYFAGDYHDAVGAAALAISSTALG